ncbi:MAG: hypothetical protein GY834_02230 [Bacteroidetes bacterium]|nr:hypothetical protein [Bacteroidota bacterium]
MLNKEEKRILQSYVFPIIDKIKDAFFDIDGETQWCDIREDMKKDMETLENMLNSIFYEKHVKYSIHGIVKRYGSLVGGKQ